jgi:hypothetical protein
MHPMTVCLAADGAYVSDVRAPHRASGQTCANAAILRNAQPYPVVTEEPDCCSRWGTPHRPSAKLLRAPSTGKHTSRVCHV